MAACAETLTPGRDRGRRQGRRARRRGRRPRRGRRRRPVGCLLQRRPDLRRGRADLRPRPGLRRVPVPAASTRRGTSRADDSPDAKIGPITMPGQLGIIRSHIQDAIDRGGRAVLGGPERRRRALRAADDPGRRARGLLGGAGGDLRPDRDRHPGQGHGRGRAPRPTAPATDWARRCSRRRAAMELAERIRSGMTAVNGDDHLRRRSRRCRSAASATPASAGSTGPTGSRSSPTPRRSPDSGSSRRWR